MRQPLALVTSVSGDAGLAAARSLARSGFEVCSADDRGMPFGRKSRFARSHHLLDNSTPEVYARALLRLVGILRPDVLLPVGARAVAASAVHRDALSEMTALNLPSVAANETANDRAATMECCESLGIPCARVYTEHEAEERLRRGTGDIALVVKPRANVGAARGVTYVDTVQALRASLEACRARYGPALIQEYVPGDAGDMKTVIVLFSADSRLVAAFTTRKRRQWPATGGLTVVSHSTSDTSIVKQVTPFFQKSSWRGPAEVELKHDRCTGIDKVIEINPRFPAYLRFAERCGLDLPTLAARLAMRTNEEPLRYPAYSVGVTYIKPGLLIKSAAWHARQRAFGELGNVMAEFRAGFPFLMDMLTDPFPFIGRAVEDFRGRSG